LKSLHALYLSYLPLKTLPSTFQALTGPQQLTIHECDSFEELPPSTGQLTSLHMLYLSFLQLKTLPSTFGALAGAGD
jgi:hypothetical protein